MAPTPLRILLELGSSDTRTGAVGDVLDLAHYARPMGVEILFCGPLDQAARTELRQRGLRTVRGLSRPISKFGLPLYALSVLVWMVRLLRLRPHVVHLNYTGWGPSLACAAHLCGIPVVARAGGPYDPHNRLTRWVNVYASSCVPHAKPLLESPAADRVFIVGDLFRPDRLHEPDVLVRPLPPRREGRPRFLFLGQLVERKGVSTLVQAFARMGADADLLLVGGDWNEKGYPRQIRDLLEQLNLGDRVHLENHRPDVAPLLRRCDVFVLPSLSDARPRSLIEAMSMGLPVVSTLVGGIPTLVEDGVSGLLVPPSDPDALAGALARLALSPELRKRMGEAARARAEAECQPERSAGRFVEMYRKMAGQTTPSSTSPDGPGQAVTEALKPTPAFSAAVPANGRQGHA